jgi:hypothetical protein
MCSLGQMALLVPSDELELLGHMAKLQMVGYMLSWPKHSTPNRIGDSKCSFVHLFFYLSIYCPFNQYLSALARVPGRATR